MLPDLATLVQPRSVDEFLADVWDKSPMYTPPRADLAAQVLDALKAHGVEDLLRLALDPVLLMHYTRKGKYVPTAVPVATALDFLETNSTVYFDLRPSLRVVQACAAQVAEALGIDAEFIHLSIFASPGGATTEWHYDSNDNFTIHLTGAKQWQVAPGTISHPLERFTSTGLCPLSLPGQHQRLLNDVEHAARTCTTIDMRPGALLFMPRGTWHKVDALEESISFNIRVRPQTLEAVALSVLRKRMLADPQWRATAIGHRAASERNAATMLRDQWPALLEKLAVEVSRLSPSDFGK